LYFFIIMYSYLYKIKAGKKHKIKTDKRKGGNEVRNKQMTKAYCKM